MREKPRFQFLNHFKGHCCCMRSSVIMMQSNFIYWYSSAFTVNSKYSIIPCTVDCLSMIMVVLKDGPIEVPKLHHHFAGKGHIF